MVANLPAVVSPEEAITVRGELEAMKGGEVFVSIVGQKVRCWLFLAHITLGPSDDKGISDITIPKWLATEKGISMPRVIEKTKVTGRLIQMAGKANLYEIEVPGSAKPQQFWLPLSQIEVTDIGRDLVEIELPVWLAEKTGLV